MPSPATTSNTPPLTIALTGASGFVGAHVLEHLLRAGHPVRALVRKPADLSGQHANLTVVPGGLFDESALTELMTGAEAVVHLVGIIDEKPGKGQTFERIHIEGTERLLAAATAIGSKSPRARHVTRWVQMSALGARPNAPARYHQTKWQAEERVRASGLAWTIFRPSIIHGPEGAFLRMVRDFWTGLLPPVVPYFGAGLLGTGGAGRLQPIWVRDVAAAFTRCLVTPASVGKVYSLCGPEVYTWRSFYLAVKKHLPSARAKPIVPIPAWAAKLMAPLPGVPFNKDQVLMSQEDALCQDRDAEQDLGLSFTRFEQALSQYAGELA